MKKPHDRRSVEGGTLTVNYHKGVTWTLPKNKHDGCPELSVVADNRFPYITISNRNSGDRGGVIFSPHDIDKLIEGLRTVAAEIREEQVSIQPMTMEQDIACFAEETSEEEEEEVALIVARGRV